MGSHLGWRAFAASEPNAGHRALVDLEDDGIATGVVTQNMAEPLVNTVGAVPNPRVVVSIGDCTRGCGLFAGSYAVAGSVDDFVEVDVHVPGCPPPPAAIVAALRAVTGR